MSLPTWSPELLGPFLFIDGDGLSTPISARPQSLASSPLSTVSRPYSNCWLMQLTLRLLQPSQTDALGEAKLQRVFRRLHSQQLWVPLRIFRRLRGDGFWVVLVPVLSSAIFPRNWTDHIELKAISCPALADGGKVREPRRTSGPAVESEC